MSVAHNPSTCESGLSYRFNDLTIGRSAADERAQWSPLVTVVSVSGDVDARNIDSVTAYTTRLAQAGDALLLDLSGVEFFAVQGISIFRALEDTCRSTKLPWALINSRAVERVLRVSGQSDTLPTANSVPEAMQYFARLARMLARPQWARVLLPMPASTSAGSG